MKTTWHEVSLDGVTWRRTSVTEWDEGVAFTTHDYPVVDPGTYPHERDREAPASMTKTCGHVNPANDTLRCQRPAEHSDVHYAAPGDGSECWWITPRPAKIDESKGTR